MNFLYDIWIDIATVKCLTQDWFIISSFACV